MKKLVLMLGAAAVALAAAARMNLKEATGEMK